ncbi:MAG: PPOX class F420-dependent oxidoreductase [Acidimicrobiia bacterium]|nr:PPOX class F420-dependent oxidoreductase [Acidimicrobiia bacterium]
MGIEEALEFVRTHHRGVLATVRSDGRPQMSPIVAAVDRDGNVIISTREPSYKVRNLRRDPAASVCMFVDGFFGPWVQIDGVASIVALPEAMDLLVDAYRQIAGDHDDWDAFRSAMVEEQRVIISIAPQRAGPNRAG